jgi:hypothetical protein
MNALHMMGTLLLGMALSSHALAQNRGSDGPPSKASEAPVEARDQSLLDELQQGLSVGDREAVLALFEYFEGLVGPREAATDRQILGHFLRLLDEEFGHPQSFERLQTLSSRYVSAQVESATADQWNASPCLFKSHPLKTVFEYGGTPRPADLIVTICTGPHVERPALRQIEFRFVNPDVATGRKVQSIIQRTVVEARRLTTSDR